VHHVRTTRGGGTCPEKQGLGDPRKLTKEKPNGLLAGLNLDRGLGKNYGLAGGGVKTQAAEVVESKATEPVCGVYRTWGDGSIGT